MQEHIEQELPKKKKPIWKFLKRLFLASVIFIVSVVILSATLVFVYKDAVIAVVIKELNKHLNAEVRIDPKNIDLTIIKSFPNCAIEFKELTAMEAKKFKSNDTLLFAKRLSLAFNIKDLFNKNYTIKNIELENAQCNLKVDKNGNANYLVWKSDTTKASSDSLKFALEKISLSNIELTYKNSKQKIKLNTSIKEVNFKGKFTDDNYTLKSDGTTYVDLFQVNNVKYLNNKKLKFDVELAVNISSYTIKKSVTSINSTQLISSGAFVVQDSLLSLDVNFNGKNLDISTTLSLLPEKFQNQINDYESDGEFYANGEFHYKNGTPLIVKADFGIKQATITHKQQNATLKNVNLLGNIIVNENRSNLTLKNISAELNSNRFSGDVELSNFKDPYLKLKVAANTKLEELILFYPIDTLQSLSGNISVSAEIEGLMSDMKSNAYSPNIKANGNAVITDLKAIFKQTEKIINIPEGKLELNNRHLNVENLKLIKGNSDVILVGQLPNFLGYLFDAKEPLTIVAQVTSDRIEVEDFIFSSGQTNESSLVSIPDNLDFNVSVDVKNLTFRKFTADNLKGNLLLKNQKLALRNFIFNATDGEIKLNVFADASGENIQGSGEGELNKLNIQKLFMQLNNFGQIVIQDNNLKGFVTSTIDFSGVWDKKLKVDLNSINVSSNNLIERGELLAFKPLESLAKYIDVNELRHIKFSTLQSAIDIKNKVITIPKTSIKSNAINLELWGKHTFDNQIDYHIQLLLSELLAKKPRVNKKFDEELSLVESDAENRRSVFILMTGPIDNPIIKYDRKGAKEKIKEDIKQEKQNLKQLLKEEFGFFKKDSIKIKETEKANQKFQLQVGDEKPKANKPLQPKKKEENEDDF
ncbi:MAG: AsmA family protein [Bacteroidia bacterium]|nr:AsmA family protein [Bacteroidia bacterium]